MKLCRSDRTLLDKLNLGIGSKQPIEPGQSDRLLELGLVVQNRDQGLEITARGQLELMRHRYSGLPKQRYVFIGDHPKESLWRKIMNFRLTSW